MSDWSALLVKRSLSPWLVDECCSHLTGPAAASARPQLALTVSSPADLKALKTAAKTVKQKLPPAARQALDEEMREIAEDSKWSKTARSRYTLTINQWIQPFFKEFRSQPQFADVAIGGHTEREVVCISGFVQSEAIFKELLAHIDSKKPPYKVWTDVRLGAWKGPKLEP